MLLSCSDVCITGVGVGTVSHMGGGGVVVVVVGRSRFNRLL